MKKKTKRILLCAAAALLVLTGACLWYLTDHYPADDTALAVLQQHDVHTRENLTILPAATPVDTALVFYPGAKVAAQAYLPLLDAIRDECGITCILVEMPFNMAIFDTDAVEEVMAAYPGITTWYLAGHSMGGAMASSYAGKRPGFIEGVVLLGAYPSGDYPLADTLTVYGEKNTSVAEKVTYTENVVVIAGGNHAGFGNYGPQKGDAVADISAAEQQKQTVEAIAAFLTQKAA